MRNLLLLAHGSRREGSNEEVRILAARLAEALGGEFQHVEAAFLELAEPNIPAAIDACVADGADEVVLLPYFLAAGRHVSEDIPEIVEAKRQQHPRLRLVVLPYLGQFQGLESLLVAEIRRGGAGVDNGFA